MKSRISMSLAVACVLVLAVAPVFADNSLAVTSAAAMFNQVAGSTCSGDGLPGPCGLELRLQDPASVVSDQAYLYLGPDKGLSSETTLKTSFFIHVSTLNMSMTAGSNHFQLAHFYEHFTNNSGVKLIVFLHRDITAGDWFITVWHYNDNVANWVYTGSAWFAQYGVAWWDENKIEIEWTQGAPGTLQIYRTLYHDGVADASGRILALSATPAGMGSAAINHVFVGMQNTLSHKAGTYGTVYLDEFVFTR